MSTREPPVVLDMGDIEAIVVFYRDGRIQIRSNGNTMEIRHLVESLLEYLMDVTTKPPPRSAPLRGQQDESFHTGMESK